MDSSRVTWPKPSPRILSRAPQFALLLVAAVWMARTDGFFSARNIASVFDLAGIVGVMAVGQTFAIIGGGFDLSQGAILGASAAIAATLATRGFGAPLCGSAALLAGAALGWFNGLCVAVGRINAFVTTLSTLLIYRGATYLILNGRQIGNVHAFDAFASSAGRISAIGGCFAGALVVGWIILRFTVFGRHLYAVGGNEAAARLSGVRTRRVKIATFALSGLASGLAAILLLAFVNVAKADSGERKELDSIAACVVGGVSLQGGSGSVWGAGAGCVLLQALSQLLNQSGFPDEYSTVATGGVILTFAAADALARRARLA